MVIRWLVGRVGGCWWWWIYNLCELEWKYFAKSGRLQWYACNVFCWRKDESVESCETNPPSGHAKKNEWHKPVPHSDFEDLLTTKPKPQVTGYGCGPNANLSQKNMSLKAKSTQHIHPKKNIYKNILKPNMEAENDSWEHDAHLQTTHFASFCWFVLWKKPRRILQLIFLGARFQRLLDLTHRFPGRKTVGLVVFVGCSWSDCCRWWFRNLRVPAVEGLLLFIHRWFFVESGYKSSSLWGFGSAASIFGGWLQYFAWRNIFLCWFHLFTPRSWGSEFRDCFFFFFSNWRLQMVKVLSPN